MTYNSNTYFQVQHLLDIKAFAHNLPSNSPRPDNPNNPNNNPNNPNLSNSRMHDNPSNPDDNLVHHIGLEWHGLRLTQEVNPNKP